MNRLLYADLIAWKNFPDRKPLILEGARQVGKTWLLKEFGSKEYENFIYINCDNNPQIADLFYDYDIDRILRAVSAYSNQKIEKHKTFIFFDEIQEIKNALHSLKYFCEQAPEYHIAMAGSLLGIKLHEGTSFPVGKVQTLRLYPMNFTEFLMAMGKDALVEILNSKNWAEICSFRTQFIELLRQYYFTGGMPAVVQEYVSSGDLQKVRSLQNEILSNYANDISKHAPVKDVPKINLVWNAIPSQLAKENKKFVYGAIKKGARAAEYENAIQWLCNAGLVTKVSRVKKASMPLKFYEDFSAFKLFVLDCGLFGAMSGTPAKDILIGSNIFSEYKGAFTEQFVAQQFFAAEGVAPYYFTNENSTLELDFVIQTEDKVIPIEVKAEENLRSKSLSSFLEKNPELHGLRFSMADYREQERFTNIPLYAIK
ncbi:MAG: ATP-binding protein [Treponema sp.]|nr:ATP-binding protein [Treponema sp.]